MLVPAQLQWEGRGVSNAASVRAGPRGEGPRGRAILRRGEPGGAPIEERYGVRWVLLHKEHVTDWRARLEELGPIARVVFSEAQHALLRIDSVPPVPVGGGGP